MATIGARLRALRQAHGLTQRAVATAADITTATVSRLELDKSPHGPQLDTLRKVAAVFGLRTVDLLDHPADDATLRSTGTDG